MSDAGGPGRFSGTNWETHRSAVFGSPTRLVGSVADAEAVTQDVCYSRCRRICPLWTVHGPGSWSFSPVVGWQFVRYQVTGSWYRP